MKFIIREVLKKEVEAIDKEEVETLYDNQDIVLGADNFASVDIYPASLEERILDITTTFCENDCEHTNTCDEDCVLRKIEQLISL